MGLPSGPYGSNGAYQVNGQTVPASWQDLPQANWTLNSPGYFTTMGIPLLRGRDFSRADAHESPFVAIISESLARQSFGDNDPLGKQLRCGLDSDKWMTIVGVVGEVRQDSPATPPAPTLYMPLTQHPSYANEIDVVMRTKLEPLAVMETARETMKRVDPQVATRFTTMNALVTESTATPRFRSWLVGGFAVLGVLLAMLGIYGVMAYTVAQRTFEVGVRMTFGAERKDILGMVLGRAMRLTAAGIVLGLVLTVGVVRLVSSMLFGVTAEDPISFAIAIGTLTLVALAAAYFPARRAASVDPLAAIRYE
jgi:predicted permease